MCETDIFSGDNYNRINSYFLPKEEEFKKINLIQNYLREEFAFIRMTETMLDKSIMDASYYLRKILKESNTIDYFTIEQGEKFIKNTFILSNRDFIKKTVSYYRPKTKKGDPRFWIYDLKKYCNVGDLIYFTIYDNKLLVIPLNKSYEQLKLDLETKFKLQSLLDLEIVKEFIEKLKVIKNSGWVKSINPIGKVVPKDVGETIEAKFGIKPNNLTSPDYKGEIEMKSKLYKSKTVDTLFSCVPNWSKSLIKSSREMILMYGYPSRNQEKYPNFIDLYVTVGKNSNPQGLSLLIDEEKEEIHQKHKRDGITCMWDYDEIKSKINEKHPKTAWIVADHKIINGENYFKYTGLEITQKPLLSQFMLLINEGHLTFDWRGRVRKDGTGYKDKGHPFRLKPKYRSSLFGELEKIDL